MGYIKSTDGHTIHSPQTAFFWHKQAPETEGCATGDGGDIGDMRNMGDRGHRAGSRSSQKWVKSLEIVFKKFLNWAIWADKADWADLDRDQTFKKRSKKLNF